MRMATFWRRVINPADQLTLNRLERTFEELRATLLHNGRGAEFALQLRRYCLLYEASPQLTGVLDELNIQERRAYNAHQGMQRLATSLIDELLGACWNDREISETQREAYRRAWLSARGGARLVLQREADRCTVRFSTLSETLERFEKVQEELLTEERRLQLLAVELPWLGAWVLRWAKKHRQPLLSAASPVQAFDRIRDQVADLRMAELREAAAVRPKLNDASALLHMLLSVHDHACNELARGRSVRLSVVRYADWVQRFDLDTARGLLERGSTGAADERALCLHLARYLHWGGVDPFIEHTLGASRADLSAMVGGSWAAVEAKVLRPGDTKPDVRKRLQTGVHEALDGAVKLHAAQAFLVVFSAVEARLSLPAEVTDRGVAVVIQVVALGKGPYSEAAYPRWEFTERDLIR